MLFQVVEKHSTAKGTVLPLYRMRLGRVATLLCLQKVPNQVVKSLCSTNPNLASV